MSNDNIDKMSKDFSKERTIKQFQKKGDKLIHPLFPEPRKTSDDSLDIYLYTLGHLWIYMLFEELGYDEYLRDIISLAIRKNCSLFEWDINGEIEVEIVNILKKYNIDYRKYLDETFKLDEYIEIDTKAKDKEKPLMRLSRLLVLAELGMAENLYAEEKSLQSLLEEEGTIINAIYLCANSSSECEKIFSRVPNEFVEIIRNNMNCFHDKYEMKYYPKLNELTAVLCAYESCFAEKWYLIPDDEQVIISKFLYSVQIIKELSVTLLGLNGILSGVSARILFDNYWQSLYLIQNNEIEKYREFVLRRMRLHIIKREDGDENISELLREVKDGYLDPIPVNGDYFTKSAREYAIGLGIKDDYDRFYEFNSEFIHASLTAVYSGIMVPCKNPEHDGHLTIKNGGARLIESIPGIFYIFNKHVELVNTYLESDILPQIDYKDYFITRSEWINYSTK